MSGRFALISLGLLLAVSHFAPARSDSALPPPPYVDTNSEQLLVLRNGEVLRGRITLQGDHYQLLLSDGELRIRAAEVELVCKNLDEAYQLRRTRLVPNRADDHLDLAEWCLRQGLPGDAARELSAALSVDPRNPRIALIDRRLQQSLIPPPAPLPKPAAAAPRVTDEDLDRMVRSLPPSAVESFTTVVQPLLISSCATSGCHGPGGKSNYTLARIPADRFANRRLTQRNLQNTLLWLNFPNPEQSRLLSATVQPHGTATTAIFDLQTSKYRQLVAWVGLVTQRPLEVPDPPAQAATVHLPGTDLTATSAAKPDQSPPIAAANRDTRPIRSSHPSRPPLVVSVHPDGSSVSMDNAFSSDKALAGGFVPPSPNPSQAGPAIGAEEAGGLDAFNRRYALPGTADKPPPATKPQENLNPPSPEKSGPTATSPLVDNFSPPDRPPPRNSPPAPERLTPPEKPPQPDSNPALGKGPSGKIPVLPAFGSPGH